MGIKIMVFDFEAALRGMEDDRALLRETLQDFIDYYGDAGGRIRTAIAENHHQDAEILAHTLKGLGGTFAADELREAAYALERSLHTQELNGLDQKLNDLEKTIDAMVSDISNALKN